MDFVGALLIAGAHGPHLGHLHVRAHVHVAAGHGVHGMVHAIFGLRLRRLLWRALGGHMFMLRGGERRQQKHARKKKQPFHRFTPRP